MWYLDKIKEESVDQTPLCKASTSLEGDVLYSEVGMKLVALQQQCREVQVVAKVVQVPALYVSW